MRIIKNESLILTRTRIGEQAPKVGLILLLIVTILVWMRPDWLLLIIALIWLGFIASLVGAYWGERFVGPLAYYKKVPEALKGLDDNYTLLEYKLPAPFVLVEPGGITVVLVKSQGGEIKYENGRWQHKESLGLLRRVAGQEAIGHPERQAVAETAKVEKVLRNLLPEEALSVPIRPVILFIAPKAHIEADDSPVPVVPAVKFKSWLRGPGRLPNLPDDIKAQLQEAIDKL